MENAYLKFHSNLPGANELTLLRPITWCIYASGNQLIVCLDNGLPSVRHQAIIYTMLTFHQYNYVYMNISISMLHFSVWKISDDSRFAPSQWEKALLCNDFSHWLGTNLESALKIIAFLSNACMFRHQISIIHLKDNDKKCLNAMSVVVYNGK